LLWRNDAAAVPLLEAMATKATRPLGRLHALCTLEGLGRLSPDLVLRALRDAHPGVRRHALRLSEPFLAKNPTLGEALAALADDADAQVRMQLAYTLGEWEDPRAGALLGRLALRDGGDLLFLAAVMSSVNEANLDGVLVAVMGRGAKPPPAL